MTSYLALLLLVLTLPAHAEFISAYSGYQSGQHSYLTDTATNKPLIYGTTLDTRQWRRQRQGWLSRGPLIDLQQGINYAAVDARIPIFHWKLHQGIWFQYHYIQQSLDLTLVSNETFLSNQGVASSLAAGAIISADQTVNRYDVYWHEATDYKGPLNLIGVFYYNEASPAGSTITGQTASVFEGVFTGYGLTLGRIKDDKGFNFQWRMHLSNLDSAFSDSITNHRAASKKESTLYQFALELEWHHRYQLAPYWYLVPHLKLGVKSMFQVLTEPQQIEHDALTYLEAKSWISLQRRF